MTPSDFGLPESKFPSYRPRQLETALAIAGSDRRFSGLSAPPGSGKTAIYMTAAGVLSAGDPSFRTLILVGTKGLMSQVHGDFHSMGMVDVRGHGNYSCAARGRGVGGVGRGGRGGANDSGGVGPRNLVPGRDRSPDEVCVFKGEPGLCKYRDAIEQAITSPFVISNYALWLTLDRVFNPDALGEFDLLILDEAHGVHDDWLTKFCSFVLTDADVHELLGIEGPKSGDFLTWAEEAVEVARERYREGKKEGMTEEELRPLEGLGKNLARMVETAEDHSVDWVVEKSMGQCQVMPVWSSPWAEESLFREIPRVVLSSATLTEDHITQFGVAKKDFDFHEVPSSFAAKRRPFVWVPTVRVDYRMVEGHKRILMRQVDEIIDVCKGWNGIIHTRSYDRASDILARSKHRGLMISHDPGGVRAAFEKFERSLDPRIFVSPSVEEGFDFKGDLARWQIVLKVPFVYGKDPLTKARKDADKNYVNKLAAVTILQTYGRSTRSGDDWSVTWILDNHWGEWFCKKVKFPKWFKSSWRTEKDPEKVVRMILEEVGGE